MIISKSINALLFSIVASGIKLVSAFPEGSGICIADSATIAGVGAMGTENSALPFTLSTAGNDTTFTESPVTLTLTGDGGYTGLLLYAASALDSTEHLGTWSDFDPAAYQTLDAEASGGVANCGVYGTGSTLSHSSGAVKPFPARFTWTPPAATTTGNVSFYAAVVVSGESGFQIVQSAQALSPA
ncbi:hypothetical protein DFJ77DRAFT_458744 [Powellomyces hirtus]|nr:hypothetical protein DFJ77DRAFT_458744 [Powellomyces hirtus]